MLEFNKKEKRNWILNETFADGGLKRNIIDLHLKPTSITNKFETVVALIDDITERIPGFSEWYIGMLTEYIDTGFNSEILMREKDVFIKMSELYIDSLNINFSEFSKVEKSSKTSIMFTKEDVRAIALSSASLKLYTIFWFGFETHEVITEVLKEDGTIDKKPETKHTNLSLPENMHREFYQHLINPCIKTQTTTKMFQLIRSRIYRSSITDRYMWDLIKIAISETPETYVMTVFNFLMINMLSTLSPERNPVPFLVSIIDDSIRWLMRTVYKDRILYGEAFAGSDDIYGSSLSKDSFYVYCCNDVVGKAAKVGMSILEEEHLLNEEQFDKIRDRIDLVDILTPPMKLLTLPIVSKVFEIPYKYLLTCLPKHTLLMGVFLYHLAKDNLEEMFPVMTEFLIASPKDLKFLSTRSSYQIRNLEFVINNPDPMFGFESKTLKFEIMSSICGVLSASKKNLVSVINGQPLRKVTYLSLEHDAVQFFTLLYSNKLDPIFEQMREKAEKYL